MKAYLREIIAYELILSNFSNNGLFETLVPIYIGFCFNMQIGEINKDVFLMSCIWIQPLPVTSHWWLKNSGFWEKRCVWTRSNRWVIYFGFNPWIWRKYTKNFIAFLFFVVYDIFSKQLMGLVQWWVMFYYFGGDRITFQSYFNYFSYKLLFLQYHTPRNVKKKSKFLYWLSPNSGVEKDLVFFLIICKLHRV